MWKHPGFINLIVVFSPWRHCLCCCRSLLYCFSSHQKSLYWLCSFPVWFAVVFSSYPLWFATQLAPLLTQLIANSPCCCFGDMLPLVFLHLISISGQCFQIAAHWRECFRNRNISLEQVCGHCWTLTVGLRAWVQCSVRGSLFLEDISPHPNGIFGSKQR